MKTVRFITDVGDLKPPSKRGILLWIFIIRIKKKQPVIIHLNNENKKRII
jgi:hypothetical protein